MVLEELPGAAIFADDLKYFVIRFSAGLSVAALFVVIRRMMIVDVAAGFEEADLGDIVERVAQKVNSKKSGVAREKESSVSNQKVSGAGKGKEHNADYQSVSGASSETDCAQAQRGCE